MRFHIKWIVTGFTVICLPIIIWHFRSRPREASACPSLSTDPSTLVPNVVNFVQFDGVKLQFVSYICIRAVFLNHNPDKIIFHSNVELQVFQSQERWKQLEDLIGDRLEFRKAKKPTLVFGTRIGNVYHANDVYKIQQALQFGGIFLDLDTFVVQSLDDLRQYETTLGWPDKEFIGIQIILAKPNATFIRLWLQSYRDYRPSMWYYNAGDFPTNTILGPCPDLIHREKTLLGVHNLAKELYEEQEWPEWKSFYSIHLLSRHRSYLNQNDVKSSGIDDFDESNIMRYNRTFGVMARSVL